MSFFCLFLILISLCICSAFYLNFNRLSFTFVQNKHPLVRHASDNNLYIPAFEENELDEDKSSNVVESLELNDVEDRTSTWKIRRNNILTTSRKLLDSRKKNSWEDR